MRGDQGAKVSDDECPGEGKCHGCMSWCDDCGEVEEVCDVRATYQRCNCHPMPPEWNEIKALEKAAEALAFDLRAKLREVNAEIEQIAKLRRARNAFADQRAKLDKAEWENGFK